MGRFVTDETTKIIEEQMFAGWGDSKVEEFLRAELSRYVPQLTGKTDSEIADFIGYQRDIYINGRLPIMGQPIASPNPTFSDSLDAISC
jgi:hypothetical protein